MDNSVCHYGNQCVEAHGLEELHEWKERFEYRKMRIQRAYEKELYGKSYTEQLLEKWVMMKAKRKKCLSRIVLQTKISTFSFSCRIKHRVRIK